VYTAFARKGWMVPNQYWTPGAFSPMPIMGKYYMYYGEDYLPPRELGRRNAQRLQAELVIDNLGVCRFHRAWAEGMIPEVVGSLYGLQDEFLRAIAITAGRINSRNASVLWETQRTVDCVHAFLKRKQTVDGVSDPDLAGWLDRFEADKDEAALGFWYGIHKGIQETLREL
jgi:glyceraldehyde-3-phosphate dehydrogenase (ferredoxin)